MKMILMMDAAINLILGFFLMIFSQKVIDFFGVPSAHPYFYPNILGAVLFGIGIALLIEYGRRPSGIAGLGLGGAVAINLCGGLVLAAWLFWGDLNIPFHGRVFLWVLVFILVVISDIELIVPILKGRAEG